MLIFSGMLVLGACSGRVLVMDGVRVCGWLLLAISKSDERCESYCRAAGSSRFEDDLLVRKLLGAENTYIALESKRSREEKASLKATRTPQREPGKPLVLPSILVITEFFVCYHPRNAREKSGCKENWGRKSM